MRGTQHKVTKLNFDARIEHKDARDGLAGGTQDKTNQVAMDLNKRRVLEAAAVAHSTVQHQLMAPVVQWERFLPLRTLKVLLVENDDSTRQVVSALLRNCCYEVTGVANGLEAWRVLQDLTNHIDLVLTEVVMPGWSGIDLLCKIMSHKTCNTIPVIMMSSNDSMGIVFKCLSMGAADFLVKPIRKNELKNLWQHIWRRCHSSSGSASESGIQGQKFTKSQCEDDDDSDNNNTDSNDEEVIGSIIGLSARNGSDNGSGTQSSWTKPPFEADSLQPISPSEQVDGPRDSTCAQAIDSRPETFYSKVPLNVNADRKEQKKIAADDIIMYTHLLNESSQTDKVSTKLTGPSTEKSPENVPNDVEAVRHSNYNTLNGPAPDQLSSSSINTTQQSVLGPHKKPKEFLKTSENKDNGDVELPSLELSLKKLRSSTSVSLNDERNVLKHSNLSAFSRYPASAASVQTPTVYEGNSALDNCSSSNNNAKISTNTDVVKKQGISKEPSSSAFHCVQSQSSTIQPAIQDKINEVAVPIGQSRASLKPVQVQQHHHHHYHHYHHHHIHALQTQPDQDDSAVDNLNADVAHCNSSNAANYSLNGSNSGSNHGSNGQNGCSGAVNTGGTNMESSAVGVAEKSGVGGGDGSGAGNHFAQREAALNKFRLKRKERNFGKKVRYQSRKRLAEQRPRVRGQFVRRIIHEEDS